MPLRLRLTLWHTVLLGLLLAGFAVAIYWAVAQQLTSQMEYTIHLQALEASSVVHDVALGQPGVRSGRLPLAATAALASGRVYVQLVDTNGRLLARSDNLAQPLPAPPASLAAAVQQGESHAILNVGSQRVNLLSTPLQVDEQLVGVLQVAAPLQPLEASLLQLRVVLAGAVLGAVGLGAALGWFLTRGALRPVDLLRQAAHAIGRSTDLSRRVPEPPERDELGRLAFTFNEMLDRLENTLGTQQRFLADASHELRTPLAAIRTNVEALLRGAVAEPAVRDETLRAVVRETDRMGRLVADLLVLARADAGQPVAHQRVALDSLLLDVYRQTRTLALDVRLAIGELEQVEVEGDADRLKQLLLNLVDNAVRATPAGGTVTLEVARQGQAAVLRVRDTGVGIPAEHLPRIFERFYRVDLPRSRATGGTGLGLAICRWIAEAHGGRISVESREGQGSTFTVLLPAAPAAGSPRAVAA